jgi:hypothetical protein
MLSYRKWQFKKIQQWIGHAILRRLYWDTNRDLGRSLLVAGTARSGTTWLASLIMSQVPCRLMFEPFHAEKVKVFRLFHYFQYMRPWEENPALYAYCKKIFTGDIRNAWVDRRVDRVFFQYRLIKEIRANLFLKWLADSFPQVPMLFIIRHPCAVVSSRMQLEWATDSDIAPLLAQPTLVEDFLADRMHIIERANTIEGKHAVIWCISNLVPIKQFGLENMNLAYYEKLVCEPEVEMAKVFNRLNLNYDQQTALEHMDEPSVTTTWESANLTRQKKIGNWKSKLSPVQIDNILSVVNAFGLGALYDHSLMPKEGNPVLVKHE